MLIESLLAQAASQPDEIAVLDDTGPTTYRKLAGMAGGLVPIIAAATQRPNIGLVLPSSAGFVASFHATLWAGKSVVPINFLLSQRELAHVIADSGIDTIVTIPLLAAKFKDLPLKVIDLSALPAGVSAPPPVPARSADDMAVLMYTSGTVGLPKGVMLSFGNFQSDVDASIETARLQGRHKFLGLIPLFHSFGITGTMLAPIQLGAPVIYMARFSAPAAVKAISEQAVSLVLAIPSMYRAMLDLKQPTAKDFASVYALVSGGEPLSAAVAKGFQDRFGVRLYEGYGLTETSAVVTLNMPHAYREGSVGRPAPTARLRIVDDDGNDVPAGQSGEVWVAGPMITKGYYHLPEATSAALTSDAFFRTGDIGRFDADGFLYIVGRKKELIIVAGEKAVPREIEEALLTNPSVAQAAVVGKKDAGRGEVVVAFVTAKEGQSISADALRQACRDAGLPQWKIPREIFIETELPRSATGKVLKRVLAERVNAG